MAAVVAVCAAAMQGGGRLLVGALPHLEPQLNDWLAARDIRIRGISGSWRHLNPIVAAESLEFPGGDLRGVTLELDVPESLWRNRIVARRFEVANARVRLERTPVGWRLAGASNAEGPDLGTFLQHSDELHVTARVEFAANDHRGAVYVRLLAQNQDGRHRWQAVVSTDPACPECSLRLDAELLESATGIADLAGTARVDARGFRLRPVLAEALSLPAMALDVAGRWTGDGTIAGANVELHLSELALPGAMTTVTATATARGTHAFYQGVASVAAATASAEVAVEDIGFAADAAGLDAGSALTLWTERLDLGAWNALLVSALGSAGTVGAWFHGVDASGELRDLQVHLDSEGLAYEAALEHAYTSSFRGIPRIDDAGGLLHGHAKALRITLDGRALGAAMPEHFPRGWTYDTAAGDITLWFDPGHLGLRGQGTVRSDAAEVAVALSLTRPTDPLEGHLSVVASVAHATIEHVKRYVPRELRGTLGTWIESGLVAGRLDDATVAYHGHTRTLPGLPMRRIEIAGDVSDGVVAYHPDWPRAEALQGHVAVSGTAVRARVDRGTTLGIAVTDVTVDVPEHANHADVTLRARLPTEDALGFVFATPLRDTMPFLCPCWRGEGELGVAAALKVPFDAAAGPRDIAVEFDLAGVSLDLADLRLHFRDLRGPARFRSPHYVTATGLEGTLFGFPVHVETTSSAEVVAFEVRGRSRVTDVFTVLDAEEISAAEGEFDFTARFDFFTADAAPPVLEIGTEALGVTLDLPAPLGKDAATPRTMTAKLVFAEDGVHAAGGDDVASWWLRVDETETLLGAVGVGVPPRPHVPDATGISIAGRLAVLDVAAASALPDSRVPWHVHGLEVDRVRLHGIELTAARLDGAVGAGTVALDFDSNEMRGSVRARPDEPLSLELDEVRLPAGEPGVDPLDVSIIDVLPAADVAIHNILLDGEHFGSWRFGVRPTGTALHFTSVSGDIKGLRIEALEDIVWTAEDTSHFRGTVTAADLASVLPAWGYATSVESTDVDIQGDVSWPGSPLNFQLDYLSGDLRLKVTDGRFLDVADVPAGRILTLLNFSKVAQRLRFDFSDVFGQGIGFERIRAKTTLDRGVLHFEEPLEIKGPTSEFRIYGTVDFHDGTLDNEMVVTLPLSSSLPWYAFWLASTNPATAAGVLLGREVFRRQLDALSSARYRVTGTLDEPEPSFVGIFTGEFSPETTVETPPAETVQENPGSQQGSPE